MLKCIHVISFTLRDKGSIGAAVRWVVHVPEGESGMRHTVLSVLMGAVNQQAIKSNRQTDICRTGELILKEYCAWL